MIRAACAALTLTLVAGMPAAGEPVLAPPIDCDLGRDCFIQQYVDHDPGAEAYDYRCAPLSYDGHKGTDFALRTLQQMQVGVNVLASAPGTVKGVRDGMADRIYSDANAQDLEGRDCGNGVVIDHGDGWETQYCHLRQGSVRVQSGDVVDRGHVLGQVGISGRAQFPHVHLSLRHKGAVIDPFDPDGQLQCGTPDPDTMWQDPPTYRAGGILDVGFSDGIPAYADVKSGRAAEPSLPLDAPALVVYGYAFGGQTDDEMRLVLTGPDGVVVDQTEILEKQQAQFFRAVGKRLRATAWPAGAYSGTVILMREGHEIDRRAASITLE
ncbi:M23 family metallopeptidase [Pseudosulfitobacter koreensis]|uniref:M23 family metallopeptidase n=1 Tax=Pseudosulfitobacter koreensis TaxID=2968472 RepID=A0ABT1YZ10_9RHOB|nr:M23 family metallopeptidase [Pseudosulfitobacter koreense]MCR8826125.1 M23 family metallopeptidase [Pseudosulfitobacter koreense]